MKYKGLIFDFDYTLGDGTDVITECFAYGLTGLGYKAESRERIRFTIGMTLANAFKELTGNSDADTILEFERLYKEKADEVLVAGTIIYPFALEMLRSLNEQNVKFGIVSTKRHIRIQQIFDKYDLGSLPSVIVGGDDVKEKKPSPEGLLLAINTLGLQKSEVLYIGDHVIDAQAASSAGVDFAAVLTGTSVCAEFEQYKHCYITENVMQLYEMLQ
ncbi:MAG: HAD family hydrolase [Eubacteriales bacterium]|nr:HAD family hydrolase [Eubacteriales bacterium]